MTTNSDELANRLGALSLRRSDQIETAVTESGARSLSGATALSALERFLDQPTIGQLSEVIGLSSSATVRLVDALVAGGHVTRRQGPEDARQSTLELTSKGRRTAKRIVTARAEVLESVLSAIDPAARNRLAEFIDHLLAELVGANTSGGWMCRLCDTEACGAEPGEPCPLTKAALGLPDG